MSDSRLEHSRHGKHGYGLEVEDGMVTASDGPVDEEILAELFSVMDDGAPEGLSRVCDLFLTGVPARLSDIGAAQVEGRMDDAAKAAHSLKGTAGAFGARRLGEVAGRLEQASLRNDGLSTAGLLEELQAEYRIFKNILEMRLAALSSRS